MRCKIDRFCCSTRENATLCVEPRFQRCSTRFVSIRCLTSKGMDCTVHIGVVFGVIVVHGVDDNSRFLCRRSIVEIDKPMAVDLALEYWEVILNGHAITQSVGIQDAPSTGFASLHVHVQSRAQ